MARYIVAEVGEIPPGGRKIVEIAGRSIGVFNLGGEYFALRNRCPHQGGPLGQGILTGTSIMCPWHAWEFDCRTGLNDVEPDDKVDTYPVKVEGQDVLIDIA